MIMTPNQKEMNRDCYIRLNTPELRQKLVDMGYQECSCASFPGNIWLETYKERMQIHGHGCQEEDETKVSQEYLEFMEKDTSGYDCGTNERLFLAMALPRGKRIHVADTALEVEYQTLEGKWLKRTFPKGYHFRWSPVWSAAKVKGDFHEITEEELERYCASTTKFFSFIGRGNGCIYVVDYNSAVEDCCGEICKFTNAICKLPSEGEWRACVPHFHPEKEYLTPATQEQIKAYEEIMC